MKTHLPAGSLTPDSPIRSEMSELERRILAFERKWPTPSSRKYQAILTEFDLTPTRYFQILNLALDKPEAARSSPQLVNRLRRIRHSHRKSRWESNRTLRLGI